MSTPASAPAASSVQPPLPPPQQQQPAAFLPQRVHSRQRIAVVGSGIAGLTAAYLLAESPL